jgi:hypothetical protein
MWVNCLNWRVNGLKRGLNEKVKIGVYTEGVRFRIGDVGFWGKHCRNPTSHIQNLLRGVVFFKDSLLYG